MDYTLRDLLKVRRRMRLSQREFGRIFGFPVATLRHWESGERRPSGAALTLLYVIEDNPRAVMRAVNRALHRHANWPRPHDRRPLRRARGLGRLPYIPI